jgi:circadian clock protein KaiB
MATSPAVGKRYELCLYVVGQAPRSLAAIANLKMICERYLSGRYSIEVVDLTQNPRVAQTDQIVAIPTLVRHQPQPIKRIIGDLSDARRVLLGLDIERSGSETA